MIVFEEFQFKTGGCLDALDVTDDVTRVVKDSGIKAGSALVFSPHTTCAVIIARPGRGMFEALERAKESLAPSDGYYRHDDLAIRTENLVEDEPPNGAAHICHVFLGKASETVPVVDGGLLLPEGQRLLFVELDESRPRRYVVQVIGE